MGIGSGIFQRQRCYQSGRIELNRHHRGTMLKQVSLTSALVLATSAYFLHHQYSQKYPIIASYQLPKQSQIHKLLNTNGLIYCDSFATNVTTSLSKEELTEKILNLPSFSQFKDSSTSALGSTRGTITSQKSNRHGISTLLHWVWTSETLPSTSTTMAKYGYPFKLMTGGFQELLIIEGDHNTKTIYLSSLHDYQDLRDGKTIPRFMQTLYSDYQRAVLDGIIV